MWGGKQLIPSSSLLTLFHITRLEVEAKILMAQPLAGSLLRQESRTGKAEQEVWVGPWKITSFMEGKSTGLGPVRCLSQRKHLLGRPDDLSSGLRIHGGRREFNS